MSTRYEKELETNVLKMISVITNAQEKELYMDATMNDVSGWDSMSHLQIATGVEEILGRQLMLDELIGVSCIRDWVDLVCNNLCAKK